MDLFLHVRASKPFIGIHVWYILTLKFTRDSKMENSKKVVLLVIAAICGMLANSTVYICNQGLMHDTLFGVILAVSYYGSMSLIFKPKCFKRAIRCIHMPE